jgi:hypothetical protein
VNHFALPSGEYWYTGDYFPVHEGFSACSAYLPVSLSEILQCRRLYSFTEVSSWWYFQRYGCLQWCRWLDLISYQLPSSAPDYIHRSNGVMFSFFRYIRGTCLDGWVLCGPVFWLWLPPHVESAIIKFCAWVRYDCWILYAVAFVIILSFMMDSMAALTFSSFADHLTSSASKSCWDF